MTISLMKIQIKQQKMAKMAFFGKYFGKKTLEKYGKIPFDTTNHSPETRKSLHTLKTNIS